MKSRFFRKIRVSRKNAITSKYRFFAKFVFFRHRTGASMFKSYKIPRMRWESALATAVRAQMCLVNILIGFATRPEVQATPR